MVRGMPLEEGGRVARRGSSRAKALTSALGALAVYCGTLAPQPAMPPSPSHAYLDSGRLSQGSRLSRAYTAPDAGAHPASRVGYRLATAAVEGSFSSSPGAASAASARASAGKGTRLRTRIVPGTLTIRTLTSGVHLGPARPDAGSGYYSTSPVETGAITVTDTRAGNPGYTVTGQATDFTTVSGERISALNLAWTPRVQSWQPEQAITAGPAVIGLDSAQTLAIAARGGGLGTTLLSATLTLRAPRAPSSGQYAATLTLTVI